ncbi:GNAT family N-acetyltransferase [Paenibacillus brevis]|uniref:GNAT family N-acetyltransferase n=1 Tax=Paenibacillus brevis TaxID=2841508 RepID=A0ABS6FPH6_9BACL|nr:GNAT family N-acetyltransferase [Paenibacillus brevis]MBU5672051.1 GNAT family N-acetyltransferase [Paenibacillus brevis]
MNNLKLIKPALNLKDEYISFYQEWRDSGEEMVPWVITKDPSDFRAMLAFLSNQEKGIGIPEGWVPDSTFWLVNEYSRVIGAVNIRHQLSPFLLRAGGHIGYGIRPSERGKGYAASMLKLALVEARKLGIQEVLVVCDAENVGSERTILRNGGTRDVDFVEEDGQVIKRFWIKDNNH